MTVLPINQIVMGDCLEIIKTFPNDSVDLVLTDPPYGDGVGYGRQDKKIENNEDESINYKIIPELYRCLKEGGVMYLFTNWKFSGKIQAFIEKETEFTIRTMLVIVKNNFGMGYGFRNQFELCWVCEKGTVKYTEADFSNVQKMQHIQHDMETHPHQKGIDLLRKMITHVSKPGDIVLDTFVGSGSTAMAAKMEGRRYIGIEISPTYAETARQRVGSAPVPLFI